MKDIADLIVFLALNAVGIWLLLSVVVFLIGIFSPEQSRDIFEQFGLSSRKINQVTFLAIAAIFFVAFLIIGKEGFFYFFKNKFVLAIVILGSINFIYSGWIKR